MKVLAGGVLILLCLVAGASAQQGRVCQNTRINHKGSSGAAITVDATAGGVLIAEANTSRCALTIVNETANPMRCAPSTGSYALTVTSSVGGYIPPTAFPVFGIAAQEAWKCIRTGGSSATITVFEELP